MSWAAHNPEKYSEIVNRGIGKYLASLNKFDEFDEEDAAFFAANLENGSPIEHRVWSVLSSLASQHIVNEEASYFSGRVDSALERVKER